MEIIVCKDYAEVSAKAYEVMKQVVTSKEAPVLGLATGSSPIGLYENMIQGHKKDGVSYANVVSFNLDEYVGIDRHHEQSYYTFMHENLFKGIDIKEENVNVPYGNTVKECDEYEAAMEGYHVDVQVLGIGGNGHIGFNEPGTPFTSTTHIVDLQERTIQDNARFFNDDMNQVPKQAITMGIATIMKAGKILLIASGANKADAVAGLVNGPITESLPASVLQNHKDVVVIVDEAAAAKLK